MDDCGCYGWCLCLVFGVCLVGGAWLVEVGLRDLMRVESSYLLTPRQKDGGKEHLVERAPADHSVFRSIVSVRIRTKELI